MTTITFEKWRRETFSEEFNRRADWDWWRTILALRGIARRRAAYGLRAEPDAVGRGA